MMATNDPEWMAATNVLGVVSTLLDTVDWDDLARQVDRADSLGPILDPTAYGDALHSGRLDHNRRAIAATRTYLAELRKIHEEADRGR